MTRDHTLGQLLADSAKEGEQATADEAVQNANKRLHLVLWNAVDGSDVEPQPDVFRVNLELDDCAFLL